MPYARKVEPRENLRKWMEGNSISNQTVADICGTSRQAVSQFVCGSAHSPKIHKAFRKLGCPTELLGRTSRKREYVPPVKPFRTHKTFFDPWSEGEIRMPFDLPRELSGPLMCTF